MTAAEDTGLVRHQSILGDTRYENDRVTIHLSLTCRDESFRLICGFHLFSTKNLVIKCVEHEPGSWKMKVFRHCMGGGGGGVLFFISTFISGLDMYDTIDEHADLFICLLLQSTI